MVRRALEVLDASGGIMTPAAFSKAADVPAARLDGLDRPHPAAAERGRVRDPDAEPHREQDRTQRCEAQTAVRPGIDAMDISRERRREIIAALRKGTVPQRGLDFLAVGLGRFEPVVVRGAGGRGQGRLRVQGGAGRLRLRQDVLRPLGAGARQEEGLRHRRGPDLRDGDAAPPAGDGLPAGDGAAVHGRLLPRGVPLRLDGWFYGLEEDVLAEGDDRSVRRRGAGPTGRRTAGAAARRDHPCHARSSPPPCGPTGRPSGRTTTPPPRGWPGGSPVSRTSPPRSSGSRASRGTWTTSPP